MNRARAVVARDWIWLGLFGALAGAFGAFWFQVIHTITAGPSNVGSMVVGIIYALLLAPVGALSGAIVMSASLGVAALVTRFAPSRAVVVAAAALVFGGGLAALALNGTSVYPWIPVFAAYSSVCCTGLYVLRFRHPHTLAAKSAG